MKKRRWIRTRRVMKKRRWIRIRRVMKNLVKRWCTAWIHRRGVKKRVTRQITSAIHPVGKETEHQSKAAATAAKRESERENE
jgi:hypothetical protein